MFSMRAANARRVARLLENTGSRIDARGLSLYGRLFRHPGHVRAALGMMANWDLQPLQDAMGELTTPVWLVAADHDRAVPASTSLSARDKLPNARVVYLRGLGHLAHEEAPRRVADIIEEAARENGLLSSKGAITRS